MEVVKPKSLQPIPQHAKKVFNGILFDVYQWEQEMYDGGKRTFEKLKRIDGVNVIALTTENKVIVLNQSQPGRERYYSLPGGMVDDGEAPLEAASRELLEETGFAGDLKLFYANQPLTKIDWSVYMFIARNCTKVSEQRLDGGEKIEVMFVEIEDFIDMVLQQKIKNAQLIARIIMNDLLAINKDETYRKIKNYLLLT